jgi:dienelactone hydrolase
VTVPTMILIGEKDDWTPAQLCRDLMKVRDGKGAELKLIVYADAYHAFNVPELRPAITYLSHHLEYNEAAARQAEDETPRFLQRMFGGPLGRAEISRECRFWRVPLKTRRLRWRCELGKDRT